MVTPSGIGAGSVAVIVLAMDSRPQMKSEMPVPIHKVGGASLLVHVLGAVAPLCPVMTTLVTRGGADAVTAEARRILPDIAIVQIHAHAGSADAVRAALPKAGTAERILIVHADAPLVRSGTLARLVASPDIAWAGPAANLGSGGQDGPSTTVGKVAADDGGLAPGALSALAFDLAPAAGWLAALCDRSTNGAQALGEMIRIARTRDVAIAVAALQAREMQRIDSRETLALVEAAFQRCARRAAMAAGVTMVAPETVILAHDTSIERDVEIGAYVVFGPGVTVESGARIEAFCHLEQCRVAAGARIGPFARLRPGADIGAGAHVGNFVEVKNAALGPGVKANHLAYLGDSDIGAGANIGAGTVTCNYDGVSKHTTHIGAGAFIGTNSSLVAPLSIGAGAYVASGSVVTDDIPDDALAIARGRQTTKPGGAARLRARLTSAPTPESA